MHPVLFKIGNFAVPTYGALLAIAFLLSAYLLKKEAVRRDLDPEKVSETAVAALLGGLIGAKILLILVEFPVYWENPRELLGTLRSAGVIYGGVLGGLTGVIWFIKKHKLPVWSTLDLFAPFAALGMGLGRLGCLAAGCCYGREYHGIFALHFPGPPTCPAPAGGLFPTQPLGFINGLLLFTFLLWLLRRRRFPGQVILAFLGLYGITRGLLEQFRGDSVRGLWIYESLSTSQIIALAAVIISAVWYWKRAKECRT